MNSAYHLVNLPANAHHITTEIRKYFPQEEEQYRQVIALAEEVGEFVGAARRYMGMARRSGTKQAIIEELADVVITAFVTAQVFDIDLGAAIGIKVHDINHRGWKEES